MPTYVYRCWKCENRVEVVRKITAEEVVPECKECTDLEPLGPVSMERVYESTSFILKGSCWAKDGYK